VKLNSIRLNAAVAEMTNRAVRRGANALARRARASVLGQGRIDTHEMIRSFRVIDITTNPLRPRYRVVNTAPHYPFQELGTPKEAPGVGFIYPTRGRALRFKPKGSNVFVFARRVRGVSPGHFMTRAVRAEVLRDFTTPY